MHTKKLCRWCVCSNFALSNEDDDILISKEKKNNYKSNRTWQI